MKKLSILLSVFFFFGCSSGKKSFDLYIGNKKDYLILKEGTPLIIYTDSIGERVLYGKARKIHNPKYTNVSRYTTFFINQKGEIYKWKTEPVKTLVPTGKPPLAID